VIDMYYGSMIYLIPAILFSFYAQTKVKSTFNRFLKEKSLKGFTGAQVARLILDRNGLSEVKIEHIKGYLTDHYDPRSKILRLSSNVYQSTSIAAISVAAHEAGHAIQHAKDYSALILRNKIAPIASISSQLVWPLVFGGLIFGSTGLIDIGILFYLGAIIFHVVTLPVEFNASSRALTELTQNGIITQQELKPSKAVLNAAALTYIAATAVSIAQLIRLLLLRSSSRD